MKKQKSMKKDSRLFSQQIWEEYSRQSAERAYSANGWLRGGYAGTTEKTDFFCLGILQ